MSSSSRSQPISEAAREAETSAALRDPLAVEACLTAAKRALRRSQTPSYLTGACPGSERPDLGWGAVASWNERTIDKSRGGPWSIEFVAALCRRGWLGVHPERPDHAEITRAGRAALKALAKAVGTSEPAGSGEAVATRQTPGGDNV